MLDLGDLQAAIAQFTPGDGFHATGIPGLSLMRFSRPTEPTHGLIQPTLCIVAQGKKRTIAGDRTMAYDAANFLVVSADTPIIGQVMEASPEEPYLCFKLDLDPAAITELLIDVGALTGDQAGTGGATGARTSWTCRRRSRRSAGRRSGCRSPRAPR